MPAAALALAVVAAPAGVAFEPVLGRRAIEEAIEIGHSRIEQLRARFHAPYRTLVDRAPVDYIETVTPFRKVVLAAEMRARSGQRSLSQLEAQQLLATDPEEVGFHIELTFHPHNTFIGVPAYEVVVTDDRGAPVPVRSLERVPRFGPRLDPYPFPQLPSPGGVAPPKSSQPLSGGTIIVRVSGATLGNAQCVLTIITDAGFTLAQARIDLSRFR
jgi:hypothetical protein